MAIDRSIEDKLREEFEARHAARENRASLKSGDGEGTSGGFSLYKSLADEQAAQKADIARIEGKIETMDARLSGKLDLLLDRKERDAKQ